MMSDGEARAGKTDEGLNAAYPHTPEQPHDIQSLVDQFGLAVLPVYGITRGRCECGRDDCAAPGKHPRIHRGVHGATTDPAQIERWREQWPRSNWAVSAAGLIVVDVDPRNGGYESLRAWTDGHGDLPPTLSVLTGGGGEHFYFRRPADVAVPGRLAPGIDLKSDGGYVLIPPSDHISGASYSWREPLLTIADAPPNLLAGLADVPRPDMELDLSSALQGVAEGQRDNALFRLACRLRRQHQSDSDGGRAAVTLLVLNAAARCDPPFPAAEAKVKIEQAFKQDHPEVEPWMLDQAEHLTRWASGTSLLDFVRDYARDAGVLAEGLSQSDWTPADMQTALDGAEQGVEPPAQLVRSDGVALIYEGLLNGLHGQSESGKTWVALLACAQVLAAGDRVLYLDFESSRVDIAARLIALGVARSRIVDQFTYVSPSDKYSPEEVDDLARLLASGFALTVLDGITDAMSAFGYGPRDESEFAKFKRELLMPLTVAGSSLITIDHVARGSDGRDALGTQHKRASVRGSSFLVRVLAPFGRGRIGKAELIVSKDRPGYVRGSSFRRGDEDVAAVFVLSPSADGQSLVAELLAWEDYNQRAVGNIASLAHVDSDRMEALVARLVDAVRSSPGVSTNDLKKVLGVRMITAEADEAEHRGLIIRQPGPRNATRHYPVETP